MSNSAMESTLVEVYAAAFGGFIREERNMMGSEGGSERDGRGDGES